VSSFVRRALIAMLVGVALYGGFVVFTGFQQIRATLSEFRWMSFAGALGLACFNYWLRTLKWEYYLHKLDIRGIPKFESALVFLSGFVLTITPGKVGEVFKSAVFARTHGVAMSRTALIVVAERLTDVVGVVLLIVIGSASFDGGLFWAGLGAVVITLGLLLILWRRPSELLLRKLRDTSFAELAPKVEHSLHSLRVLSTPRALPVPVLLSVVGWGAEGCALWLLLQGFEAMTPLPVAVFFYATATLAGALIPVPGGLGVTETLLQQQLVALGETPAAVATASMILVRVATLWWAVVVGFGALWLLDRRFGARLGLRPDEPPPVEGSSS